MTSMEGTEEYNSPYLTEKQKGSKDLQQWAIGLNAVNNYNLD